MSHLNLEGHILKFTEMSCICLLDLLILYLDYLLGVDFGLLKAQSTYPITCLPSVIFFLNLYILVFLFIDICLSAHWLTLLLSHYALCLPLLTIIAFWILAIVKGL